MIMPSKVIQPVDSLISISATILEILQTKEANTDELLEEVNAKYYKKITIEKLFFCLDFLFLLDKIEEKNEVIAINI